MRAAQRLGIVLLLVGMAADQAAASDDVVVIVSVDSKIAALTKNQVSDIFLGRLKLLTDGKPVDPIDQPEGSPTRIAFYAKFVGKTPAELKAHWAKIIFTGRGQPPPTVPGDSDALLRVAQDPRAIAYIDRALADGRVKILIP
jgi:ABC-type phosphate transport system substrate-binding protein